MNEQQQQLLSVEQVSKRYGTTMAVGDVSLRVAAGEVYALVGANGAGKSTLLRMIVGISAPDAGRVIVAGEDLKERRPSTKRRVGYLAEELLFYERLTGREYLRLVAGLREAEMASVIRETEFFRLSQVADKWIGTYSLGMRKKLGLATAFIGQPDLVVLDEPLNGLDVEMMRLVRERIEAEQAKNRAVLVSSHVMSFVERIANRVGMMRSGRLVAEGTPDQLRQQARMPDAPFEDVFFRLTN